MKTILYTGYDEPYAPLCRLTLPAMRTHAQIAAIDFRVFEAPPEGLNIYWTGVARGLELLREGYERVVYLDADQLCTNPWATPWADVDKRGFHASRDWGDDATEPWHFSMCGVVMHQDCVPLLKLALKIEPEWREKPFQEQGPMQYLFRNRDQFTELADTSFTVHRRRMFNAVPDAICPDKVPEPWRPNDWCAHLTMVDMTTRIKVGSKIWELHPRENAK